MYCAECGTPSADGQKYCTNCGKLLIAGAAGPGSAATAPPAMPPPLPMDAGRRGLDPADVYASFFRRFAALVVDYVILAATMIVLTLLFRGPPLRTALLSLGWILGPWLYFALMESSAKQATIGKMTLGIKVCSRAGERIGFGRATGRFFARWLSSLVFYIGYLMAAFTSRRQALHDMLADTLVVREAADAQDIETAIAPPNGGGTAVVIAVLVLVGISFTGILAAIAIPAYQDYTIRAQVTEGLQRANGLKAEIAERLVANTDAAQINSELLGIGPPADLRYVETLHVENASILLRYGRQANRLLAGKTLLLVPALGDGGDVFWICGRGDAPNRFEPVIQDYARYTSVEPKYLPSVCR